MSEAEDVGGDREATWNDIMALSELLEAERKAHAAVETEPAIDWSLLPPAPPLEYDFDDITVPVRSILRSRPIAGLPTPFNKVEGHPRNQLVKEKFAGFSSLPYVTHPGCLRKKIPMPNLKSKLVRVLLEPGCRCYFEILQQHCVEAKDLGFYEKAISAAATFACLMISKDGFYNYAIEDRIASQASELWEKLKPSMRMARTVDEVWKKAISQLTNRSTKRYSLLTEPDIADIVFHYYSRRGSLGLDLPYHKRSYPRFSKVKQDEVYQDVNNVVTLLDSSIELRGNGYTRLLIEIVQGKLEDVLDSIIPFLFTDRYNIEDRLDADHMGYQSLCDLKIILRILLDRFRDELSEQLVAVMYPMTALVLSHQPLCIQPEVVELVEVSELRRRALGSRFLGREMFVWAFYECGYGLPPKICDHLLKQNIVDDEDHAYSKICIATVKLALCLGASHVELSHLMFVVLYPSHMFDDNQVTKSLRQFKSFLKELRSDMLKRSKPDAPHSPKSFFSDFESHSKMIRNWSH